MQIVYFSQKAQILGHFQSLNSEVQFIAPSPAKADSLRLQLHGSLHGDVITIAKFTSNLMQKLWQENEMPQVKRKAELLLIFGMMKNRLFPDLGYEQFMQAYNLFSELRSFTLNLDALTSVLEAQPQVIKDAVNVFWQVLEGTGFCDEHAAYQLIAEKLRSIEEEESFKKTYVFWGFQHLNGQQIDLLKALSIRYQVIIPFPEVLKNKLKRSDWLSWLLDHRVEELHLPEVTGDPQGLLVEINSREISLFLKERLKGNSQVVLGVSKLKPSHIDLLPASSVNFKVPHELIGGEIKSLAVEIADALAPQATGVDLINFLQERKHRLVQEMSRGEVNFKKLKAIQLFEEAYASISIHTDEAIGIDDFYQKLLRDVAQLNQPRTSLTPLLAENAQVELKDMSSLQDIADGESVLLCIDERFEDIQGLGPNYAEKIQKELSSIGPLKRNELDLLFRQWEFRNLFARATVTVLMPAGVLKHNLIWKRLFQGINLIPEASQLINRDRVLLDHLLLVEKRKYEGNTFSASRLQTYLDCPRKFYFKFVEKISPRVILERDIDPLLSGTISHKIIEVASERQTSPEDIPALTTEIMATFIKKHELDLPREVYLQRHLIFRQRAINGLDFLGRVGERVNETITWKMEEDFATTGDYELNGTIDCLGVSENYLFLLDFKSSTGSASSGSEIESMTSIQLWVYTLAIQKLRPELKNKKVVLGYVVLNKPEESNLVMFDSETYDLFRKEKFATLNYLKKESFEEYLEKAQELMDTLALNIRSEEVFAVKPQSPDACQYCELARICVKGALHGQNS